MKSLILVFTLLFSGTASALPIFMEPSTCTEDLNEYGNASICECKDRYEYNEKLGQCEVQIYRAPSGICTTDINQWGNPSGCTCDDFYNYNSKIGSCIVWERTKIGACTRDRNQWGHASRCQCPEGERYNPKTGRCR